MSDERIQDAIDDRMADWREDRAREKVVVALALLSLGRFLRWVGAPRFRVTATDTRARWTITRDEMRRAAREPSIVVRWAAAMRRGAGRC